MNSFLLTCIAYVFLSFGFTRAAQGQESGARVYEEASPNVVSLLAPASTGTGELQATGFFIADGRVVTNYHVAAGTRGEFLSASWEDRLIKLDTVLAWSQSADLAVLGSSDEAIDLPQGIEIAEANPRIGSRLIVIGNPHGLQLTISEGLLSGLRFINGAPHLQISAPISPGSSGSPVLDYDGRLIGIVSSSHIEGQALNFASSIESLRNLSYAHPASLSAWARLHVTEHERSFAAQLLQEAKQLVYQELARHLAESKQSGAYLLSLSLKQIGMAGTPKVACQVYEEAMERFLYSPGWPQERLVLWRGFPRTEGSLLLTTISIKTSSQVKERVRALALQGCEADPKNEDMHRLLYTFPSGKDPVDRAAAQLASLRHILEAAPSDEVAKFRYAQSLMLGDPKKPAEALVATEALRDPLWVQDYSYHRLRALCLVECASQDESRDPSREAPVPTPRQGVNDVDQGANTADSELLAQALSACRVGSEIYERFARANAWIPEPQMFRSIEARALVGLRPEEGLRLLIEIADHQYDWRVETIRTLPAKYGVPPWVEQTLKAREEVVLACIYLDRRDTANEQLRQLKRFLSNYRMCVEADNQAKDACWLLLKDWEKRILNHETSIANSGEK